jgi:hypothetical protein
MFSLAINRNYRTKTIPNKDDNAALDTQGRKTTGRNPCRGISFWIKRRLLKYDGDSDFGIWVEAKSSNTLIKFYTSVIVPSRGRLRFLRLQFSFVEVTETITLYERFPKLTSVLIFGCCEVVEFEHPLTNLENLTLFSFRKRLVSDSFSFYSPIPTLA